MADGDCQAPTFQTDDHVFCQMGLQPRIGEYCFVRIKFWRTNEAGELIKDERGERIAFYVDGTKRLRQKADRSLWWTSNQGDFPVKGHQVLGVVMFAVRYPDYVKGRNVWTLAELRELFHATAGGV
jgi:hypothetical protein